MTAGRMKAGSLQSAILASLVLILAGCATSGGGRTTPAPVDDIGVAQKRAPAGIATDKHSTAATRSVGVPPRAASAPASKAAPRPATSTSTSAAATASVSSAATPSPSVADEGSSETLTLARVEPPSSATALTAVPAPTPRSELSATPVSSPVAALLETAREQQRQRNLEAAAATLERAVAIEPRNALVWSRLAELRFEQTQYAQAAQLAAKSNSFAGGDTALQARNWKIIAIAKETSGDTRGATAAYRQAEQLEEAH